MKKNLEIELKVGLFVSIGLGLIMLAILVLGGPNNFMTRSVRYVGHFPTAEGLIVGAKVSLGGVQVGAIDAVDLDPDRNDVKVQVQVARKYEEWIRKDSRMELATQGVLGDKYIMLTAGSKEQPQLPPGGELEVRGGKGLSEVLSKSDQLMVNLNSIAENLDKILAGFEAAGRSETFFKGMAQTSKNMAELSSSMTPMMKNLGSVMEKINNGTGTLGALINDPALYYDARALMGGANRNRIVRNLVRKTIREGEEAEAQDQEKK